MSPTHKVSLTAPMALSFDGWTARGGTAIQLDCAIRLAASKYPEYFSWQSMTRRGSFE